MVFLPSDLKRREQTRKIGVAYAPEIKAAQEKPPAPKFEIPTAAIGSGLKTGFKMGGGFLFKGLKESFKSFGKTLRQKRRY